jgi:hypothetical protein
MASLTSSNSVAARRNDAAWASLVLGLCSVVTVPLAVYLTRFSAGYRLIDSAYSIPFGAGLGVAAIVAARHARRRNAISLGRVGQRGIARVGRLLGIAGICLALTGLIALGVYGLLVYAGTRG